MRLVLVTLGLLMLAACAQPMQTANNGNLTRFVEPTHGAAYSQGDARYYENYANPYPSGGAIAKTK
jgi:hypothetical protein